MTSLEIDTRSNPTRFDKVFVVAKRHKSTPMRTRSNAEHCGTCRWRALRSVKNASQILIGDRSIQTVILVFL
jgi:hypothetical protein